MYQRKIESQNWKMYQDCKATHRVIVYQTEQVTHC